LTAGLCLLLIAASLLASGTSRDKDHVIERDGSRTIYRRALGFIETSHMEADPALHVSEDFRKRLALLRIKLPPELGLGLTHTLRQRLTSLQDVYTVQGEISGSPKNAIDFFVRQVKGLRRYSTPHDEQVDGVCSDRHTQLNVVAYPVGGRSEVLLHLTVLR